VVAFASVEAGIAWRLSLLETTEERLKCSVDTEHNILQDLAVDLAVLRQGLLDIGEFGLLLVVGDREAPHPPSFPPLAHGGVVEVTAEQKEALKVPLLFRLALRLYL
jgi:hypothetical protein